MCVHCANYANIMPQIKLSEGILLFAHFQQLTNKETQTGEKESCQESWQCANFPDNRMSFQYYKLRLKNNAVDCFGSSFNLQNTCVSGETASIKGQVMLPSR
jgi:hypothetical protein